MIVDESPVTNEEQDTTINTEKEKNSVSTSDDTEQEDNSVSTSGEEYSCLRICQVQAKSQFNLHKGVRALFIIVHYTNLLILYGRAWVWG